MKKLGVFSIAMMNIVIVANLQIITATATYGYSLVFFYLLAAVAFFLPCMLLIAQLSTSYPITGGAYVWVEKAFGKRWGFFASCLVWLSNVIWYPTIFSFLASLLAYLIAPDLAQSALYTLSTALVLFWGVTLLNSCGIRVSSFASTISSLSGVILPTLILIALGCFWLFEGKPSQISFSSKSFFPNFSDYSHWAFLTQVVIGLIGIEMSAVHAGEIERPKRTLPKAMGLSSGAILLLVVLAPLAISLVIPQDRISIVDGLVDALKIFFQSFHIPSPFFSAMLIFLFLGNLGSTVGWMIGSTRSMQVASIQCRMPLFFQMTNRFKAPLGILLLEAIIFSLSCTLFFFSTISNSYWILLQLASQVTLLYYVLIFAAATKLKPQLGSFCIPGGSRGTLCAALLASTSSLLALILGFFPPKDGTVDLGAFYPILMVLGIVLCSAIPFLFLRLARH